MESEIKQISVRIREDDLAFINKMQARILLEDGKKLPVHETIHELVIKWDSLITSYDSLNSLDQVEQ